MRIKFVWGTCRMVLLIGKFAFKFPKINRYELFLRGLMANRSEKEWYKYNYQKEKLAAVLFYFPFGLFTVMQRAESAEGYYNRELAKEMFKHFPLDNKIQNFGVINGKLVLVDYEDSRFMCSDCTKGDLIR